jgi:apolipoprotein N-acyltransferase
MAILSGVLLWLAHPTPGLWWLAWIGLAPIIIALQCASSARRAAAYGYIFAWAYLAPTWYWTGLTIVGWTGSPVGWAALFLLTMLAALFYAGWASVAWWLSRRTDAGWRILGIAASWVVMEWLRSVGSLSFPWAQVGYTQYRVLPVIQISEFTGALGVSFLILLVNASIAEWRGRTAPRQGARWLIGSVSLVGLMTVAGAVRMGAVRDGPSIQVAVMQGNFDYRHSRDILNDKLRAYESLTAAAYQASGRKPDLYVWAETAAPGDAFNDEYSRAALQSLADRFQAAILTGSRVIEGETETNSALLFTPGSQMPQRFDKQGIVPFGEYIPFRAQIPVNVQKEFQFFDADLTPGRSLTPMAFQSPAAGSVSLGPFICYESVYPHYTRTMTARGANLLVTPSHDQWFMSEAAMEQHLAIVVFRAIENRRDVARSTTDGITAVIDGRGRIVSRAPLYTATSLIHTLHLRSMLTIYTRFGDWFVGICAVAFAAAWSQRLAAAWLSRRPRE